jgi:hypothetical protein
VIPIPDWRLIVLAAVVLVAGGYIWHCENVKGELATSVALAKQQAVENAKQALRDMKKKERSDEDHDRRMARLRVDIKRLRDASASILPPAAPGAADPSRITFDRAELDAALRKYRQGVLGIVEEGGAAVEGLDTAKVWAAQ